MIRLFFHRIFLLILGLTLPAFIFSQNLAGGTSVPSTIPEQLRRPVRGEAPRFPRDMVIGELGQGTAPERAWHYAQDIAAFLVAASSPIRGQSSARVSPEDREILNQYVPVLQRVEPRRFNLGGGRTEVDGSVSFLVRFIGRQQWIAGELYLRLVGGNWRLDELILEGVRTIEEGRNNYIHDFTPYERFF